MNNSDDPGGQSFLEYIGENYYNERAKLEKICQTRSYCLRKMTYINSSD